MDVVQQVNPTIQKTLALASRCTEDESSENYGALEDQVGDLESRAREAFQAKVDFAALLPKLERAQLHLRALCREAREVLADLVFYSDAKERANKFQVAIQESTIDADGYRFLAEIVRQMWMSEKM